MPQIFQVLKCYKCSIFQVHQTRKDNKWVCKICGEKQSVKRHYGIGTSKDCRTHVQKLNKLRGEKETTLLNVIDSEDSEYDENVDNTTASVGQTKVLAKINKESKWSLYIDEPEQQNETREPVHFHYKEIVLEIPSVKKSERKVQQIKRFRKSINIKTCNVDKNNDSENETDFILVSATNIKSNIEKVSPIKKDKCLNSKIESQIYNNTKDPNMILNKVNMDSKWAQYIETVNSDDSNDNDIEKNCNKQPLFSLCDDCEIDTILDL